MGPTGLYFLFGLNVNRVGVDLVGHGWGARRLLGRSMLLGRGLTVFHAVFESLDRTA